MEIPRLFVLLVICELRKHVNDKIVLKCQPFGNFNTKEIISNIIDETQFGKIFVYNIFLKVNNK